ncbi:MAG: O-antigen ligase family protein [Candidatus Pelagibacter sp.]|nr:O-antigen ligase family protein [Candidatus Pelagibacter sp.]
MTTFDRIKTYLPYLLPVLLTYSRSIADLTIVLVGGLFLFKSYQEKKWEWTGDKWFIAAVIFCLYCILINSPLSIKPFESLAYSIFFIRWPIFAMALVYWILNDKYSFKKFIIAMIFVLIFIIFDTWWQYFSGSDIFGYESYAPGRLTGPFRSHLYVGAWIAKLAVLPPLIIIIYDHFKPSLNQKKIITSSFILMMLAFLTVYISGERMALLLITTSVIFYLLGIFLSKDSPKGIIFGAFILCLICIILFANHYPGVTDRAIYSTVEKIINWKQSDYGLVWRSAYDVWMQSPITGVGLHKYREACNALGTYGTLGDNAGPGVCFHPHNISLELLSETGVIGFILFFSMVATLFISQLKDFFLKGEYLKFSLIFSTLFTCFLPIASSTSFFSNKYASIIWLLIGAILSVNNISKNLYKHK